MLSGLAQTGVENWSDVLDLMMAVIYLLNDEHPEIRSYLVQAKGARAFFGSADFRIESPSLVGAGEMKVDLNEQMLIKIVLSKVADQADWTDKNSAIANFFAELIIQNPYREHNAKNFDDKIFFFEPINKYLDLMWLKKTALEIVSKKSNTENRADLRGNKKLEEAFANTKLPAYYNAPQ